VTQKKRKSSAAKRAALLAGTLPNPWTEKWQAGRQSKKLADSSSAAAEAMDSTVGDGLPVEDSSLFTIVVSTPRGQVVSQPLPFKAVAEIRDLVESGIARIERLSVNAPTGPTIIPGDLLRQSLIEFVRERAGETARDADSHTRRKNVVARPGKPGAKRRSSPSSPSTSPKR
jgi:hypothetical protein